jgi:SOS-response transcriptional repressor LexA
MMSHAALCPRCRQPLTAVGLTTAQAGFLLTLAALIRRDGRSPSYQELLAATGYRSRANIHRLMTHLKLRGYVVALPFRARSVTLTAAGAAFVCRHGGAG